ncbi:DUF4245 domain-containing protein [Micrococcus sp. IITD107]|uniref:DUF4245 domain-containing protein n=1 Tax=Micrococcus sp. IITD107 TaxID=3342790 RepID=UPI0035B6DA64
MTTSSTTISPAPKPRLTEKQAKRAGQSAMAMVLSVLATLAVAMMVYFLNPGSTAETYERPVDVDAVATQATAGLDYTALSPEVPEDWRATYARLRSGGADQVPAWEAGYVTGQEEFVGLTQTDQSNPTWLSQTVKGAPNAGQVSVGGTAWALHEPVEGDRHLVGELEGTTVVISGSGELSDLEAMATALQAASAGAGQ